ncbi:MAG: TetR/AcrR family transcriptional regulator [Pseudoclavibacter sp.]
MRTSKREHILDAAYRVIEREGVTALTYDSVAAEADLTKGGLLYHFPSREALIVAIHEHRAALWEAQLESALGSSPEGASAQEKLAAYARVAIHSSHRSELLLMLETSNDPALNRIWTDVLDRWAPDSPATPPTGPELEQFVARLAADGPWLYEALTHTPLPRDVREHVANHLADRIQAAERQEPADRRTHTPAEGPTS